MDFFTYVRKVDNLTVHSYGPIQPFCVTTFFPLLNRHRLKRLIRFANIVDLTASKIKESYDKEACCNLWLRSQFRKGKAATGTQASMLLWFERTHRKRGEE